MSDAMVQDIKFLQKIGNSLTLLYVEDNPLIQQEYLQFLRRIFSNIHVANNGEEGIELFKNNEIDLVITDIEMPLMSGLEMGSLIKMINPDVHLIFMTAYNDTQFLHKAIQMAADGYLIKPIDITATIDTLRKSMVTLISLKENERYKNELETLIDQRTNELLHSYTHDTITGISTLSKFEADLEKTEKPTLILCKVMNFKELNDLFGYEIGNNLLKQFSTVLQDIITHFTSPLKESILGLYRTNGAKFALLCKDIPTTDDIEIIVNHFIRQFENQDFFVDGHTVNFELQIGIAEHMYEGDPLAHADMALDVAISTRKNFVFYTNSLPSVSEYETNVRWITKIKNALSTNNIINYYQPIIDNASGEVIKYESLVRLVKENKEVVSPQLFLSIAKKTKVYQHITKKVVSQALHDFKHRKESISINISVDDILNLDTQIFLLAQINQFPEPQRIIFELLESERVESFEEVENFFKKIRELGCKIAIDDFGTGYSNFAYLIKLHVDYIKIDGSIIKNLANQKEAYWVLETIVNFAKRLEIKTIAEFVSSQEILDIVTSLGINESQGFEIGQPAPIHEIKG